MSQTYASGESARLTKKLNPSDVSLTANTDVGVSIGRFYLSNDNQKEWISFTGKTNNGDGTFSYTGLTRGLSQTADPATSGTGLTWLANQQIILVAMHDQIVDKSQGITPRSFTTAQRDALTVSNGAFIYNSTLGLPQIFYGGAWYDFNTAGSATPNGSETVAGKFEEATQTENDNGTSVGGTGADLVSTPAKTATTIQKSAWTYTASTTGTDTYTATMIPTLTAYTTGMKVRVKFTTANTGACSLNLDSLGAKNIKTIAGFDPADNDIAALSIRELVYDGTNFVLLQPTASSSDEPGIAERATAAEATTGTDDVRFITPKGVKDNYTNYYDVVSFTRDSSLASGTQVVAHALGVTPKQIFFSLGNNTGTKPSRSQGSYVSSKNMCLFSTTSDSGNSLTIDGGNSLVFDDNTAGTSYKGNVTAVSTTNFTITWTKVGAPTAILNVVATLIG